MTWQLSTGISLMLDASTSHLHRLYYLKFIIGWLPILYRTIKNIINRLMVISNKWNDLIWNLFCLSVLRCWTDLIAYMWGYHLLHTTNSSNPDKHERSQTRLQHQWNWGRTIRTAETNKQTYEGGKAYLKMLLNRFLLRMILQTSTKASENEGMGAKGGAKSPNFSIIAGCSFIVYLT